MLSKIISHASVFRDDYFKLKDQLKRKESLIKSCSGVQLSLFLLDLAENRLLVI